MSTTEPEPRHLHVHLGPLDPGVVHVHIHLDTHDGEVTAEPAIEPTVETSLSRLKNWDPDHAEHIQAAYDGLAKLGLTPHPAGSRNPGTKIQPYLRWTHPSHGSVGYLNAATFSFARKADVPRVSGLPGAAIRGDEVRFPILSPKGVAQAIAAVKAIVGGG